MAAYLRFVASKSYVAQLGPLAPAFVDDTRREMLAAFPDGVVREPFRCRLAVARPLARRE